MTIHFETLNAAERVKILLDAGSDVTLAAIGDQLHKIDITTSYIRVTFRDGSKLQRVWVQGVVWVLVP